MEITKPIFVIGAGRSGSTEFHSIFSEHPHVAWLCGYAQKYPDRPSVNRRFMEAIDWPLVGPRLKKRLFRGEFYGFWDHYFRGFSAPFRDLYAEDVTLKLKKTLPGVLAQLLSRKRNRLLIKITGWPRIGFLSEIFPDAKFVHVKRDGRAVANSSVNVEFWRGWSGPDNWGWGDLSPEYQAEWERHGRSFVALAGIQWKLFMDAVDHARTLVDPGSFLEITYEQMCADPAETFRHVARFSELEWLPEFEASIRRHEMRDANSKWRKELTPAQQAILEDVLRERLVRCGYAVDSEPAEAADQRMPAGPSRSESFFAGERAASASHAAS